MILATVGILVCIGAERGLDYYLTRTDADNAPTQVWS